MAIIETRRSPQYDPVKIDGRFVMRKHDGSWKWIETQMIGKRRYDVREGTLMPSDLPVAVMDAALDRFIARTWPPYTEWPKI